MADTQSDPIAEYDRIVTEQKAAEAKALAEMFTHPGICLHCGASVALPEQHKRFHDDIRKAFEEVSKSLTSMGDALVHADLMRRSGGHRDRS